TSLIALDQTWDSIDGLKERLKMKKHEKLSKREREESGDSDEVATEEDKDGEDGNECKRVPTASEEVFPLLS
nr:hypothetical protein [Tanacetum cinerariifolium]